ncbi:protein archease-like [Physella acuta]|uniref:protein archease-like n=1 Tax=Physella acuta TaxID=109671 RepID=UPI0027DC5803|nr:protein archease-like [Physella acuta]XP_059167271.1 protein archease-like [Physella acuta]XP_059167272.1 protein archease-like [Physella acuta]XP_059167273.1 protein archease-like [Physella acuta]
MDEDENEGRILEEGEAPEFPEVKYEYLDHTADVQLHAWGCDIRESFEQVGMAMFNYMTTDYSTVELRRVHEIEVTGEDLLSLLYHYLDEFLFLFSAEPFFFPRIIQITEFDLVNFKLKAVGYGEPFDISKHPQGTEVKAITYSNMQVHTDSANHDVFVIIDI